MFSSTKRPDGEEMVGGGGSTVVAHGVRVEGTFVSQGDVVIEGDVEGKLTTSAMLSVGSGAKVKAEVSASEAVIAGFVDGTVSIAKRLELKSTARITGDISCETILVEAGASINGKMSVGSHKSEAKPATKGTNGA